LHAGPFETNFEITNKTDMKEKLINALAEALEMESGQIRSEDKLRDYENYSSLSELSVLAMLDSEFGIEIEMSEFNKYETVRDLIQLIEIKSSK
jgi:acyl carrier protein